MEAAKLLQMLPSSSRSISLFTIFGIHVSLHWSWFLVAVYSIQSRANEYSSITWNIAEYLGLFAIVLMHEFGHALACRQTGGQANEIVLWPLGGVAYVSPPPRPGATLWSIAAGPLVNVVLAPILLTIAVMAHDGGWNPNLQSFFETISTINLVMLAFNILPIYPLDGGQILRSLLWFGIGPIKSLAVASGLGLLCAAIAVIWALTSGHSWLAIMALFLLMTAWRSFRVAVIAHRTSNSIAGVACWVVDQTRF